MVDFDDFDNFDEFDDDDDDDDEAFMIDESCKDSNPFVVVFCRTVYIMNRSKEVGCTERSRGEWKCVALSGLEGTGLFCTRPWLDRRRRLGWTRGQDWDGPEKKYGLDQRRRLG